MNKSNVEINGVALPYFCKECAFPCTNKEEDKGCNDLCCHPANDILVPSAEALSYKFRSLINYNESKIARKLK